MKDEKVFGRTRRPIYINGFRAAFGGSSQWLRASS